MAQQQSDLYTGIPLARYKSKPGSRVIVFLTLEAGLLRAHARGSSTKKKTGNSELSLFSTYALLLSPPSRGGELQDLRERRVWTSRPKLNSGNPIETWATASVLCELPLRTLPEGDPHPYLFNMLDKALDCLEAGTSPTPLMIAFLIKHVDHLGFGLRLEECVCGKPSEREQFQTFYLPSGGILCPECLKRFQCSTRDGASGGGRKEWVLSAENLALLKKLRLIRFEASDQVPLSSKSTRLLVDLLGAYIEFHFDIRMKSLNFWRRINN